VQRLKSGKEKRHYNTDLWHSLHSPRGDVLIKSEILTLFIRVKQKQVTSSSPSLSDKTLIRQLQGFDPAVVNVREKNFSEFLCG
jgi:hypothetical protein